MKYVILFFTFFTVVNFAQNFHEGQDGCRLAKIEQFKRLQKLAEINYPGDTKYDVKYYKLDIKVNHTQQTISGNITCNAQIVVQNVSQIYYDLTNPLTVDSVLLNGIKTTFLRDSNQLKINLNGSYNSGYKFATIVYYHGTPGTSGFGSFEFTNQGGSPLIWTLSEPYGAKDWWPCKDTPADKADSADIWITVSSSLTAASNGKLINIVNNVNGTRTFKWKSSYPIAQYLISMAITNYSQYTNYYHYSTTDSMPINHFLFPSDLNSNIEQLNKTPGMIEVYSDKFGQYPFIREKYGHAQFGWGGGMEHQTITSMVSFGDGLISHELAHMWYGDNITCKDWHHIWLNEGFATYGEAVIYENWYGKSGYDNYLSSEMNSAKNAVGSIWVQNISDVWEIFNGDRTYSKGSVVLHMLRGIVGDSTFFNIMRTYTSDPSVAYGVATTEDFKAIAEEVSGLDLNYFFQEWIYGENYPTYNIVWSKSSLGGNQWNLSIKIMQNVNSTPSFYTMPVKIKVSRAIGDTTITLFNNAQIQTFNISINGQPTAINFDSGNWILKTVGSIVTDVEVEDEIKLNSFSLEQNYPNPFNPSTKIKYSISVSNANLASSTLVQLKVYDILGNEIATLVNEEKPAGNYEVEFNPVLNLKNPVSGVYFYKLKAGSFVETKKMVLLK